MAAIRMSAMSGLVLLWQQLAPLAPCAAAAAVVALLAFAIAAAGLEAAAQRRHAFRTQYLAGGGRLFRLLRPGVLMAVWQTTKAALLAVALALGALALEPWQRALLLADAVAMAVLIVSLARLLEGEVRAAHVAPLARRWGVRANALLVWIALVVGLLFTPQADLRAMRWEEVVSLAVGQVAVGCPAIALLSRVATVGSALAAWGAQNLFAEIHGAQETLAAWFVFLAAFGASFLFAWGYSLALAGVVSAPWRAWGTREG
jgi:hypothetical protein